MSIATHSTATRRSPEELRILARYAAVDLAGAQAADIIRWTWNTFGTKAVLTQSMANTALAYLINQVAPEIPVVFLDTGYHFPETIETRDALQARTSLIDCCPYFGVLSLNAIFAADAILVPVATDYLSMQGAQQITRTLATLEPVLKRRIPRRYLLTRFDRRKRMCIDIRQRLHDEFGAELCQTVIRENVAIATSPLAGTDIIKHQPLSAGATDYRQLFEELAASEIL